MPRTALVSVNLNKNARKLVQQKLKSGNYAPPEDVVLAGLNLLSAVPWDKLEPGELAALVDEGEESIRQYGTIDGAEAFRSRLERRRNMRSKSA